MLYFFLCKKYLATSPLWTVLHLKDFAIFQKISPGKVCNYVVFCEAFLLGTGGHIRADI